ncbi:sensor histidine kinase [Actinoallomurus iriomotensis]|uniref:sensor histidine kinase n=1 Tax=Actinoallomurus iriomotensis TaxID=478107 RepID=UPI0025532D78|nr:sensor histidine kinase [Actinoallomurus iriomotensis]
MTDDAALVGALIDAVLRAPARAGRRWRWQRGPVWPAVVTALLGAMAIGFSAGAIAIMIVSMHVNGNLAALLGLAQAVPLAGALRWPLGSWRIMALAMVAGNLSIGSTGGIWPWPVTTWLAMVVVLFQVGVCCERRTSAAAGMITAVIVVLPAVPVSKMPFWFALILCGIIGFILIFADALSGRYAAEARLAEQAALHERDRARQAVLEERARIARELHDVVAHHMSVIVLQSEAAPYKIHDLPDAALGTFGLIRDAAREALAETRRVVGLLREEDETAERLPQPGLDRLDELVERARHAGLDVDAGIDGMPRRLSAGVDLSAFRIVQEALSNACRYAPGSRVRVRVRYGARALTVSVSDDGSAGEVTSEPGGGHGLVGVRERVTMLGGTLTAGPAGDGFSVAAELPYARSE